MCLEITIYVFPSFQIDGCLIYLLIYRYYSVKYQPNFVHLYLFYIRRYGDGETLKKYINKKYYTVYSYIFSQVHL